MFALLHAKTAFRHTFSTLVSKQPKAWENPTYISPKFCFLKPCLREKPLCAEPDSLTKRENYFKIEFSNIEGCRKQIKD